LSIITKASGLLSAGTAAILGIITLRIFLALAESALNANLKIPGRFFEAKSPEIAAGQRVGLQMT
jgi:hypothetical protein